MTALKTAPVTRKSRAASLLAAILDKRTTKKQALAMIETALATERTAGVLSVIAKPLVGEWDV